VAKPPLVMLHGFSDDGICWVEVTRALEADFDIVMFDMRGHGRSSAPVRGYTYDLYAADIAGAIRALGLVRPLLLGHSLGAIVSLSVAGLYPELPRAILLEDPPAFWVEPQTGSRTERHARMRQDLFETKRLSRDEMLRMIRARESAWSDPEINAWADAKRRISPWTAFGLDEPDIDWPKTIGAIRCPALVFTGSPERGAILTPATVASLRTLLPQLEEAQIAACGHCIHRDHLSAYVDALRGWVK
jgi:N-formylmaleamate deformylase